MKIRLTFALAVLLCAAQLSAQVSRTIRNEQKFSLAPGGSFVLENGAGNITIVGANVTQVEAKITAVITAQSAGALEEARRISGLLISGTPQSRVVRTGFTGIKSQQWSAKIHWDVRVPKNSHVRVIATSGGHIKVANILGDAFAPRLPVPPWAEELTEADRLGAKTGKGLYRYDDGRRTVPDAQVYTVIPDGGHGSASDPSRLVDRMVLRMVDEAARCLAEGVVASPDDLDLAMVYGTGFPPFRGGLCRWADQQVVRRLVVELERLASAVGERFEPSHALREAASAGGFHARWPGSRHLAANAG